jgi:hypothetical protein
MEDFIQKSVEVGNFLLDKVKSPATGELNSSEYARIVYVITSGFAKIAIESDRSEEECECGLCEEVLELQRALDIFMMGWIEAREFGGSDDSGPRVSVAVNVFCRQINFLKEICPDFAHDIDAMVANLVFGQTGKGKH